MRNPIRDSDPPTVPPTTKATSRTPGRRLSAPAPEQTSGLGGYLRDAELLEGPAPAKAEAGQVSSSEPIQKKTTLIRSKPTLGFPEHTFGNLTWVNSFRSWSRIGGGRSPCPERSSTRVRASSPWLPGTQSHVVEQFGNANSEARVSTRNARRCLSVCVPESAGSAQGGDASYRAGWRAHSRRTDQVLRSRSVLTAHLDFDLIMSMRD